MFESTDPGLWWFIIGLICIAAEIIIPGFIIIFFGVGAWVTAILYWLGITSSFNAQLIAFISATVVSLVAFRKQGKKYFEGKVTGKLPRGTDLEDAVGERAVVTADIVPGGVLGTVEFHGTLWRATADSAIAKGSVVTVVRRDNLTLHVQQQ